MRKLLLLFLLFPLGAFGQSLYRYENILLNQTGQPIVGANVYVCTGQVTPIFQNNPPCSLATVYSDVAGTLPITQPIVTASSPIGSYAFVLSPATYTVVFTGAGVQASDIITVPLTSGGFTQTIVTQTLNNIQFISGFGGGDLGAKMNAAVTNCLATFTACKYVLDTPGTISTPPTFPMGSIIECTATAPITLATTWNIQHRNIVFEGNGCQFNYNQDTGNAAFLFGKNLTGTLTATGTNSVTWVSGSQFTQFDPGDQIYFNGGTFNICAVPSATVLTLCANASAIVGASFTGYLDATNDIGTYLGPDVFRNVTIVHTGANTQLNKGIQASATSENYWDNVNIMDFSSGYGFLGQALLTARAYIKVVGNRYGITLDQLVLGGVTITSNVNDFTKIGVYNSGSTGWGIGLLSAGENKIGGVACNLQGNGAQHSNIVSSTSPGNVIQVCDMEVDGDGSAGSVDWYVTANGFAPTYFYNNSFSGGANRPAQGIVCTGAGVACVLENNLFASFALTTAYTFSAGADTTTGSLTRNNITSGLPFTDPVTSQDNSGNYRLNSIVSSPTVVGSLPSAAANPYREMWVSDSTAVAAEGQACVGGSTNKAKAVSNGVIWKCF